jgi:hypothetical protein
MSVLPRPRRMSLSDTISYVAGRCNCPRQKASKAVHAALGEGTLQAIANRLIADPIEQDQVRRIAKFAAALDEDQLRAITNRLMRGSDLPTHPSEYVDTGLRSVPAKLWLGYPWAAWDKRSRPRGNAKFREQTADGGGEVGPVWSNPTIATADIDTWFDRGHKVLTSPTEEWQGLSRTIYEAIEIKPRAFGFAIDLKLIFERVGHYLHFR